MPLARGCTTAAAVLRRARLPLLNATITAALLHDVLEDTPVTYLQLAEQFGDEVARLVEGLSKLTNLEGSKAEAEAESAAAKRVREA